jgi:hypothetical protein
MLEELGGITRAERENITRSCNRPRGSVNVSKFARIAEGCAAIYVARLDDGRSERP